MSNSNYSDSFLGLAVGLKKAMSNSNSADMSSPVFNEDDAPIMPAWQPDGEVF